jgi:AraC-like DNA-binding protein
MPKVRTMDFIREQISVERDGDNRRLRALEKVLPPELKPFSAQREKETVTDTGLIGRLEAILKSDRIYLNDSLTLAETANLLGTNTTHLSRQINEHYGINFSAFLNGYRIAEARRMILDNRFDMLSIEGIAKSSGFRSKSTFNQAFRNSTGFTPTEFASRNGKKRA